MDIEYRLDGPEQAPLLVLSNSLGTTYDMWEPQREAFCEHFRVLRYNQRGHGNTPAPDTTLTLAVLGQDVIRLLDHLDIEKAYFCGISMGGLTGQWLNRFVPERLKAVVIANTSARIGQEESWKQRAETVRAHGLSAIAESSPSRWFTREFQQQLPEKIAPLIKQLAAGNPTGYAACCDALAAADLRREIPQMQRPMLVIAGEADPVTTVADGEFLVSQAPDAKLLTLPASHLSNIACPQAFNQGVISFLTAYC